MLNVPSTNLLAIILFKIFSYKVSVTVERILYKKLYKTKLKQKNCEKFQNTSKDQYR